MPRTASLCSKMSEMFGRWLSPSSESAREREFVSLSGDAVIQVKSQRPTLEIPADAAFDIRKPLSFEEFEAEMGKQIRILRLRNPQKEREKVAVVFRLREGNVASLLPDLRRAANLSAFGRDVATWYFVVAPNVTKEEAVARFNEATGGRGQVKHEHVDAVLRTWNSKYT